MSIFFRVTTPDGTKVSHLFGTMHINDKDIITLPIEIKDAFDNAAHYVFEAETSNPSEELNLALVWTLTQIRYGYTSRIPEGYSTSVHYRITRLIQNDPGNAFYWRSLLKNIETNPPIKLCLLMMSPHDFNIAMAENNLDKQLITQASAQGKNITFLETTAEQLHSTYYSLNLLEQIAFYTFVETCFQRGYVPPNIADFKNAYLRQDLEALINLSFPFQHEPDLPAAVEKYYQAFLTNRDQLMVNRMRAQLDEGNCFVAVGALHLQGIIAQLRNYGCQVEPVPIGERLYPITASQKLVKTLQNAKALRDATEIGELDTVQHLVELEDDSKPDADAVAEALLIPIRRKGSLEMVRVLLNIARDNKPNSAGISTALIEAAKHNRLDIVQLIIESQEDNLVADSIINALRHAIEQGSVDVFRYLFEFEGNNKLDAADVAKLLHYAAAEKELFFVQYLVELQGSNKPDKDAITAALQIAVNKDREAIIRFLFTLPEEIIPNAAVMDTAVLEAAKQGEGQRLRLRLLLAVQGYKPDAARISLAFIKSVEQGYLENIRTIIDLQGDQLLTNAVAEALSTALFSQKEEIVKLLLALPGASKAASKALIKAAKGYYCEGARQIIRLQGNNLDADDIMEALVAAIKENCFPIVELLLSLSGKNKLNATAISTSVQIAAETGHLNILLLVLQAASNRESDLLEALYKAIVVGKWSIVNALLLRFSKPSQGADGIFWAINRAALEGHLKKIVYLLSFPGDAKPDAKIVSFVLKKAAMSNQWDVVIRILQINHNKPGQEDVYSILSLAAGTSRQVKSLCLKLLLENYKDMRREKHYSFLSGISGYSKADKLNAVDTALKRLDNPQEGSIDKATLKILNNGQLGNAIKIWEQGVNETFERFIDSASSCSTLSI